MSSNKPDARAQMAEVTRRANILYFRSGVFEHTEWMGVKAAKCPMDMWVLQELMVRLQTDLVIETGTWLGGSALYFAHVLDLIGHGQVVTVDVQPQPDLPQHPRIEYLVGSSVDADILEQIGKRAENARSVLVILDSDHKADHKLKELNAYAPFVTPESYLVAEDSCFDFFPAWPEFGPGPAHAVREFLRTDARFEVDRRQERHMITFSPAAFLKRRPARSP